MLGCRAHCVAKRFLLMQFTGQEIGFAVRRPDRGHRSHPIVRSATETINLLAGPTTMKPTIVDAQLFGQSAGQMQTPRTHCPRIRRYDSISHVSINSIIIESTRKIMRRTKLCTTTRAEELPRSRVKGARVAKARHAVLFLRNASSIRCSCFAFVGSPPAPTVCVRKDPQR